MMRNIPSETKRELIMNYGDEPIRRRAVAQFMDDSKDKEGDPKVLYAWSLPRGDACKLEFGSGG